MAILHKNITASADIHNPKWFSGANNGEPTGSLDLNTAKEIFELLYNQKKPDRLIVFATHNRFFADKADCLLEITDGSVKTINV